MRHLLFYFRHAATNLRNSGHWTLFAVFCVAAGVATVVALRSLGLSITDSLLSNLRQYNHGDINISAVSNFGPFMAALQRGADETTVFSDYVVERMREWVQARGGQMTPYTLLLNLQITSAEADDSRPQFSSSFLIDPQTFGRAAPIVALEPSGVPLSQLFTGGSEVALSQNLADTLKVKVGQTVQVSGTDQPFTVVGILPTDTEASINNILAAFFGFAYFDVQQAATLGLSPKPNNVGIILPNYDGQQIDRAANEMRATFPHRDLKSTPQLIRRNTELADMLSRFIVALGLGALLIGGVGIMNTMLVLIGRRSMEIASLKTFGLKGRQVASLFLTEAFLLGGLGSFFGVLAGLLLSRVVNTFGEAFLQQQVPWRVHPEAITFGIVLGLLVTMVFGVMPVLMAARVRPALVLRPNETHIPRASLFEAFVAIVVVVIVLGIVAGQIIGPALAEATRGRVEVPNPTLLGIALVAATVIFLGALVAILWLLVWVIGHLPSLGRVDLRLALRNLSTRRLRTATTLLALTAGMFALSSISYFGLGAREIIRIQFAQTLGGNVMVVPLVPDNLAQEVINTSIRGQPGVDYVTELNMALGRLAAVDGVRLRDKGVEINLPMTIMMRETDNPDLSSGPLVEGRDLTPDDRGKNVIVLVQQSSLESLVEGFTSLEEIGVKVGSTVTLALRGGRWEDFEVIGIVANANGFTPNLASAYIPPDVPGVGGTYTLNVIQVQPEHVSPFLNTISKVPLVLALDITFIDTLLKRLLDQMSSIPTVVGLLSLFAAAVIMANTVSLTILERRQQIGILKALGLKRDRVLRVVLLENTVIGLLGGLLGIGMSSLLVSVMTLLGAGSAVPLPSEGRLITVGLLLASVGIAWLSTLLSARVAIREQVARILRYE
jgi:ABC-type antimicrobial peptide transport system permease subunit